MNSWFLVVPPRGAARTAAEQTAAAFRLEFPGFSVKVFDSGHYSDAFGRMLREPTDDLVVDLVNHALVVQCLDAAADRALVFALSPVTIFTLRLLRRCGVKTIHWFYEDFRRAGYWKDVAGGYDLFLGVQRGALKEHCERIGTRFGYLPTACASLPPAESGECRADVAFVGIPSPYRISMLERLQAKGIRLAIAGSGWERYRGSLSQSIVCGSWVDAGAACSILAGARVGVNLSFSDAAVDRENTQVSPRVFDILAAGRGLVTEDVPLAHETLDGYTYGTFGGADDFPDAVSRMLAEWDNSRNAREENRRRVAQRDTYAHRVRSIVTLAGELDRPSPGQGIS